MDTALILSVVVSVLLMVRFITLMGYILTGRHKVDERLRRYAKR